MQIVNPRTNTGVFHYVTSVRKTLFVSSNKWEFIGLVDSGFSGFSLHRRNFLTYFQYAIADISF